MDTKPHSFPKKILQEYIRDLVGKNLKNLDLHNSILSQVEKILIAEVLRFSNQNHSRASDILGINRNTLRRKITSLKIQND